MARESKPTDFTVDVEGIGKFTFARRTMRDELAIQREYSRIIDGDENPTQEFQVMAWWLSVLPVLTVSAPADWGDVEEMDPFDPKSYGRISKVYDALRSKENSFCGGKESESKAASA